MSGRVFLLDEARAEPFDTIAVSQHSAGALLVVGDAGRLIAKNLTADEALRTALALHPLPTPERLQAMTDAELRELSIAIDDEYQRRQKR